MDQATSAGRSGGQHLSTKWSATKQHTPPTASSTSSRGSSQGFVSQHNTGLVRPFQTRYVCRNRVEAAEKSKLTQQHHSFRIEADGTPQSYIGRFTVLRSPLVLHGTILSDTDAHRHSVRNLSPAFRMCVVCFHPIYSERQDVWTYQPGSHRRKVTEPFSAFVLRCLP